MRELVRRLTWMLGLAAGLVPGLAGATTVLYQTDAELVAGSDRVVHGRVLDLRTEAADGGRIYTIVRLAVREDFTGFADPIVELRELGGWLDGRFLFVAGAARFAVGQEVLVCLRARPDRTFETLALSFSTFDVVSAPGGERVAVRAALGLDVLGHPSGDAGVRSLDEFRHTVERVKGSRSVRQAPLDAAQEQSTGPVSDAFTLLGSPPIRWRQADSGTPVSWYRNTDYPSPLTSGSADNEIAVSLSAWSAPPAAGLQLTYGGGRALSGGSPFCTSANAGAGLITFEDPTNEINAPVLAIGGGCGTSAGATTVNGTFFYAFSHGYVVFNNAAELGSSFRVPPNFTRVLTHEIGHGIGLGHTQTSIADARSNIMYPSCCSSSTPLPPALGSDDLAGLAFVYPAPASCSFTLSPTSAQFAAAGGSGSVAVTASHASCAWSASSSVSWVTITSGASGQGNGTVGYQVTANAGSPRSTALTIAAASFAVSQQGSTDSDGDGLPDAWEVQYGLSPSSASGSHGASGDADGDGLTNLQELQQGTHPRGFHTRYLAEGSTGVFFDTRLALVNPSATTTSLTLLRFLTATGASVAHYVTVPPLSRRTIDVDQIGGLEDAAFSTVIESDALLVADRSMSWDASGYGAHAEAALVAPAVTWYLAEGATHSTFDLFYLIQNPGASTAQVQVTYLLPAPRAPLVRSYSVAPRSRFTIWVDVQDAALASTDVSAVLTSTNGVPIIVERAMYLTAGGQTFGAGHGSAGVTSPGTRWFLAEGATGPFFDEFVLLANPNDTDATVSLRFLLPNGSAVVRSRLVPRRSRVTVWVDVEDPRLADTAVSAEVTSTNGVPIIVERAMWWPGTAATWREAHNSPGNTATGARWAVAGGEVGGNRSVQTYLLLANTSASAATVRVTLLFEGQAPAARTFTVVGGSRFNVDVAATFPEAANRRFGALIESLGSTPVPIVVERAMYWNAGGMVWAAGTDLLASRLP